MVSKLLGGADASISRTTSEDLRPCHPKLSSVSVSPRSCHLQSRNSVCSASSSSSSSSFLMLHLHHSGYSDRRARSWNELPLGCIQAASFHNVGSFRPLRKGREKRTSFGSLIEGMLCDRSRQELCFCTKLGDNSYHALGPYFGWNTCITEVCLAHNNKSRWRGGCANVCKSFLPNFLKKRFSTGENVDKRERDRQRALLALCAQAMVASHMAHSPVLSFLWSSWPSMVNHLSPAGHGGGHGQRNLSSWQEDCIREPNHASFSNWKVLLLGFSLGTLISMTLSSTVSVGALLDGCFWLCLLCSLVFLVAWSMKVIFSAVVFIAGGGIMSLCKSLHTAFQRNVCVSFFQGLLAGPSTFASGLWLRNMRLKQRVRTPHLSISRLWS